MENYQAAAKLAAFDRHYHLALAYQLKALTLESAENLGKQQFDNQSSNLNQEIIEKISNINKDLITDLNKSTDGVLSVDDNKESTTLAPNSNGNNEEKDNNSNHVILDTNDATEISITNGNSNYMKIQKLEQNENLTSPESKEVEENTKSISENQERKSSLDKNNDGKVLSDENIILTYSGDSKESSEEVENKNKRNSEINLNNTSTKSELNENSAGDSMKDKAKVEFSEKIDAHFGSQSSSPEEKHLEVAEKILEQGKKSAEDIDSSSSISTPESLASTNAPDSEMHAFAVQGGTEQMSEGHRYLTSPDSSSSPLASEEQSLVSPEPYLPQATNQISEKSDISLIPINKNGDLQNTSFNVESDKVCINKDVNQKTDVLSVPPAESASFVDESSAVINTPSSTSVVDNNYISYANNDVNEQNKKSKVKNSVSVSSENSHMLINGKTLPASVNESVSQIVDNGCKSEESNITSVDKKYRENGFNGNEQKKNISSTCVVENLVFHGKEINDTLSAKHSSSDRTDLENYENELKDNDKILTSTKMNNADSLKDGIKSKNETTNCECTLAEKTGPSLQNGGKSNLPYEGMVQETDIVTQPSTNELGESSPCKDLVAQAAVIVEYYVSVMEEDSHAMMSRLLQQVRISS